MIFMILFEML